MGTRKKVAEKLKQALGFKPATSTVNWVLDRADELRKEFPFLAHSYWGSFPGHIGVAVDDYLTEQEMANMPVVARRQHEPMRRREPKKLRARRRYEGREHVAIDRAIRAVQRQRVAVRWDLAQ